MRCRLFLKGRELASLGVNPGEYFLQASERTPRTENPSGPLCKAVTAFL